MESNSGNVTYWVPSLSLPMVNVLVFILWCSCLYCKAKCNLSVHWRLLMKARAELQINCIYLQQYFSFSCVNLQLLFGWFQLPCLWSIPRSKESYTCHNRIVLSTVSKYLKYLIFLWLFYLTFLFTPYILSKTLRHQSVIKL